MTRRKKIVTLLFILMGLFLLLNTTLVWKWMYPIRYQEQIKVTAERYNVSPHLILAIIRTESAFDASRVSKKGALGLMQIMPDTAVWVSQQAGVKLGEQGLAEPMTNIEIGTWYLAYLLKIFKGDEVLTIAAYNAGQGKVNSWLAQNKWDGSRESIEDIPYGETRHYVQRVLYFQDRYKKIYGESLQ